MPQRTLTEILNDRTGTGHSLRADEKKMNHCKQVLEDAVFKMALNLKDPVQKQLWDKLMQAMEFAEQSATAYNDRYNENE